MNRQQALFDHDLKQILFNGEIKGSSNMFYNTFVDLPTMVWARGQNDTSSGAWVESSTKYILRIFLERVLESGHNNHYAYFHNLKTLFSYERFVMRWYVHGIYQTNCGYRTVAAYRDLIANLAGMVRTYITYVTVVSAEFLAAYQMFNNYVTSSREHHWV